MTPGSFFSWVQHALSGDSCIYHVGYLPYDRIRNRKETMAGQSASLARDLSTKGLATLTQRRLGVDRYEYRIIMR